MTETYFDTDGNYFDLGQEDALHDAFLMIEAPDTDYESLEDVLRAETTFSEEALSYWSEHAGDCFDE
jgi:hypothetical protein